MAQTDQLAVFHVWFVTNDGSMHQWTSVLDASGTRDDLFYGHYVDEAFGRQILGVRGNAFGGHPTTLQCFDVSGDEAIRLAEFSTEWDETMFAVDELAYLWRDRGFDIYDPDGQQGRVDLGLTPWSIAWHGDLVVMADDPYLRLFSLDLESGAWLTPRGTLDLDDSPRDFWFLGDLLLIGRDRARRFISLADPANPVWIGQSRYGGAGYNLCLKPPYLLNGGQVLPLDCNDPLWITAPRTDDELPTPAATTLTLHPNPFNPRTTIAFDLTREDHVTLTAHDLRGRNVATLADQPFAAGHHTLTWSGTDGRGRALPSGTYLVRLSSDTALRTAKAVLLR